MCKSFLAFFGTWVVAFGVLAETGALDAVKLTHEGRNLLQRHEAGFNLKKACVMAKGKGKSKVTCRNILGEFDVALAVKRAGEPFKVVEVLGRSCVSKTLGFETSCARLPNGKTNGVNTQFEVLKPGGYQVFAIRRVITDAKRYKEVVYTPYADFFDTPSVRRQGDLYIEGVITSAYKDLETRRVRSLANREAFVHDRVPRQVIENLVVVEHIDHARFAKEPIVDLAKEVYTILGVNKGLAYNYAKSSAQARGLLQVIPSTYAGLKRAYPNAGLVDDFVAGMTNHQNAIKAAILLADHDVGVIPDVSLRTRLFADIQKYRDYVASAYNGGPARAMSLLVKGQDHERDNRNQENRIYVAKIRAVAKIPQGALLASL